MSFYTPSVAVDPIAATSQALVLANRGMQYPATTAVAIPGRSGYMYGGSYAQPYQYGYQQPMYMQQQLMYPSYGGYGGMPMSNPYMHGGASTVIVQDPYGYSRRRHRRHRRYSYGGYPSSYY